MPIARPATVTGVAQSPARSLARRRPIRQPSAASRFRRAAALALGLLVSVVAVEAAARAGRR
jgi:hypothetical protein